MADGVESAYIAKITEHVSPSPRMASMNVELNEIDGHTSLEVLQNEKSVEPLETICNKRRQIMHFENVDDVIEEKNVKLFKGEC